MALQQDRQQASFRDEAFACMDELEKEILIMTDIEHGHDDLAIDSAYSLRPCRPHTHQHRNGDKDHFHIGVRKPDGTRVTMGVPVHELTGDELDAELLRRAEEAYPALAGMVEKVRLVGLRSEESEELRGRLADTMNERGSGRLTGADVFQIRVGTFERMDEHLD